MGRRQLSDMILAQTVIIWIILPPPTLCTWPFFLFLAQIANSGRLHQAHASEPNTRIWPASVDLGPAGLPRRMMSRHVSQGIKNRVSQIDPEAAWRLLEKAVRTHRHNIRILLEAKGDELEYDSISPSNGETGIPSLPQEK